MEFIWGELKYVIFVFFLRGELVIGCPWLAEGYYEMKEKTEESFYQEGKQR